MKQIEVTVKVNNTLDEVDLILKKHNFKIIRKSRIEDIYMTQHLKELKRETVLKVLSSCVLLRFLNVNNKKISKKITYKNKHYKGDMVITEEKINIVIDDIKSAEKLFTTLSFEELIKVNYDVIVYEKEGMELAFQDVENLGLLLEYESPLDHSGKKEEQILTEKQKMVEHIKSFNIDIGNNCDVKKAYELILNKYNL